MELTGATLYWQGFGLELAAIAFPAGSRCIVDETLMRPFATRKRREKPDLHPGEHSDAPGEDVELNSDESFPASGSSS